MSNFALDFLKQDFALKEVELPVAKKTVKTDRNPEETFLGIRLWSNGAIYPSVALVTAFSLEYSKATPVSTPKMDKDNNPVLDEAGNPVIVKTFDTSNSTACGFDVFDSNAWGTQYPEEYKRLILISPNLKTAPKIDLFGSTRYEDDGTPKTSVLDQGAATFGNEVLIPMLKEVYGIEIEKGSYIDMELAKDYALKPSKNGVYALPKQVTRGANAGKPDYVRRENINIYPLVPVLAPQAGTVEDSQELSGQ